MTSSGTEVLVVEKLPAASLQQTRQPASLSSTPLLIKQSFRGNPEVLATPSAHIIENHIRNTQHQDTTSKYVAESYIIPKSSATTSRNISTQEGEATTTFAFANIWRDVLPLDKISCKRLYQASKLSNRWETKPAVNHKTSQKWWRKNAKPLEGPDTPRLVSLLETNLNEYPIVREQVTLWEESKENEGDEADTSLDSNTERYSTYSGDFGVTRDKSKSRIAPMSTVRQTRPEVKGGWSEAKKISDLLYVREINSQTRSESPPDTFKDIESATHSQCSPLDPNIKSIDAQAKAARVNVQHIDLMDTGRGRHIAKKTKPQMSTVDEKHGKSPTSTTDSWLRAIDALMTEFPLPRDERYSSESLLEVAAQELITVRKRDRGLESGVDDETWYSVLREDHGLGELDRSFQSAQVEMTCMGLCMVTDTDEVPDDLHVCSQQSDTMSTVVGDPLLSEIDLGQTSAGLIAQVSSTVTEAAPKKRKSAKKTRTTPHKIDPLQGARDEEAAFKDAALRFPTARRPKDSRRQLFDGDVSTCWEWINKNDYQHMIGNLAQGDERNEAARLLYTWRDLFVFRIRDLPATDLVVHRIPIFSNAKPSKAYSGLYNSREEAFQKDLLKQMEDAGVIVRCLSPWGARTNFVGKKDSLALRMVHNYIPINGATIKAQYPMRRIEPILKAMTQSKVQVMFKADASNGYWAVKTIPEDQYKTAFVTILGQYMYTRMGQGLTGASATYGLLKEIFTSAIPAPDPEPTLEDVNHGKVVFRHFMDDDMGGAETFRELFDFLHGHYFPRLSWARLTLNPKKSSFFLAEIEVLGFTKSARGVRPSADKMSAIRQMQSPKSEEELNRFLYMLPFLSALIPGRADLAAVMRSAVTEEIRQVTVKGKTVNRRICVDFNWTDECEDAFRRVRKAILDHGVVGGDDRFQYHLATDASKTGIGGVLFQTPTAPPGTKCFDVPEEDHQVVMYLSAKFTPTESRWGTSEREAYAMLWCLEETSWLTQGTQHPVLAYTDHQALIGIFKGELKDRLARWQLRFSIFHCVYTHVPGKELAIADGLSRLHPPAAYDRLPETDELMLFNIEDSEMPDAGPEPIGSLRSLQTDEYFCNILEFKQTPDIDLNPELGRYAATQHKRMRALCAKFFIVETEPARLAYKERDGKTSMCIARTHVPQVLYQMHDLHGHFAGEMTLRRLRGIYYWPTRVKDTTLFCLSCVSCQMLGPLRPSAGLLPILELQPLDLVGFDFIGPITPVTARGNRFIFVIVDYNSRRPWGKPLPDATGESCVRFFKHAITDPFGFPIGAYSDNGPQFTDGPFPKFLDDNGVKRMNSPFYSPRSVGLAEKIVNLIKKGIRTAIRKNLSLREDWDLLVDTVIHNISTRAVKLHGFTPSEIFMGFNPRRAHTAVSIEDELRSTCLDLALARPEGEPEIAEINFFNRLTRLDEMREIALTKRVQEQIGLVEGSEQNWMPPAKGDLVLVKRMEKHIPALDARWKGPYVVKTVNRNGASAKLADFTTGAYRGKYHLNHLKAFVQRPPELDAPGSATWEEIARLNEADEQEREGRDPPPAPPEYEQWDADDPDAQAFNDFIQFPTQETLDLSTLPYWVSRAWDLSSPE